MGHLFGLKYMLYSYMDPLVFGIVPEHWKGTSETSRRYRRGCRILDWLMQQGYCLGNEDQDAFCRRHPVYQINEKYSVSFPVPLR